MIISTTIPITRDQIITSDPITQLRITIDLTPVISFLQSYDLAFDIELTIVSAIPPITYHYQRIARSILTVSYVTVVPVPQRIKTSSQVSCKTMCYFLTKSSLGGQS